MINLYLFRIFAGLISVKVKNNLYVKACGSENDLLFHQKDAEVFIKRLVVLSKISASFMLKQESN